MKYVYLIPSLLIIWVTSILPSNAEPNLFTQNAQWSVYKDINTQSCTAYQNNSRASVISISARQSGISFTIFEKRLSGLTPNNNYNASFMIDRSRWNGQMKAIQYKDMIGLSIANVNNQFIAAFRQGLQMQLIIHNQDFGPYTLKGTAKVMNDLGSCYKSLSETNTTTQKNTSNRVNLYEGSDEEWTHSTLPRHYVYNDTTLSLYPTPSQNDEQTIKVEITKAGNQPIRFSTEAISGNIGVQKFQHFEDPQIILSSFNGGAHCCSQVYVVDVSKEQTKLIDIGLHDGDAAMPKDIDGDGLVEFSFTDERFFIFSSYAASFPPMTILTVQNGALKDITRQERFIPYHENHFSFQSEACNNNMKSNSGACAGLLGTAAILGIFDATLESLDFDNDLEEEDNAVSMAPYTICANDKCSQSNTYDTEKPAILEAIRVWNYEPAQIQENAELTNFVKRLDGKEYTDTGEQTELSCEDGPAALKITKGPRSNPLYHFLRYESGCSFNSGTIMGNSVLAKAVCMGEGEPMWIENFIYTYDGENFSFARIDQTAFDRLHIVKTKECSKQ